MMTSLKVTTHCNRWAITRMEPDHVKTINGGWYAMMDRIELQPKSGALIILRSASHSRGYHLFLPDKIPFAKKKISITNRTRITY